MASSISAFVVGSGRASRTPPAALSSRLAKKGEPGSLRERLASKADAAVRAKADREVETARRAANALARRQRAAEARAARTSELAEKVERSLERAAMKKQSEMQRKQFAGLDVASRAKAAARAKRDALEAKKAKIAASMNRAEALRLQEVERRRAKAAAVTERHAAVTAAARERGEEARAELALRMQDKEDAARASRLTQYGLTMSRNIAHTLHVLHIAEAKESYNEALRQYGQARLDAKGRRAALNREMRLEEVRSKAHEVVEHAKEKAMEAKHQLELSLSLTSSTTAAKMARAAVQQRLIRSGELLAGKGEKLSICGEFIIGADGSWRPVPPATGSPAGSSARSRSATPTSLLDPEQWEHVQSPTLQSPNGSPGVSDLVAAALA